MSIQRLLCAFAIASCLTGAGNVFAEDAADTSRSYPLSCKSPLNIDTTNSSNFARNLRIHFQHNPTAYAGIPDPNLLPGNCAWADRPLRLNEPNTISLDYGTSLDEGFRMQTDLSTIQSCAAAADQSCTLFLYVYNNNDGTFTINTSGLYTIKAIRTAQ